jgi:FkbM family methyltransferase
VLQSNRAKKALLWLVEGPPAYTINFQIVDKLVSLIFRFFYITLRIFLRITAGKTKRKNIQFYQKLAIYANLSISFYIIIFFYKLIRLLRLGNPSLIQIYVPKFKYKVYCPATIDDFINMTSREEEIIEHFNPKENDTVIDIGAHLGRYALIGAKKVGNKGKVITIEANPLVFEKLKKNLELNKVTNTIALNYAVFSEKTKINLFVREEDSTNTEYSLRNTVMVDREKLMIEKAKDAERVVEVNADTLDNILDSNSIKQESVNWIKIDVEGAEFEVLKGAINTLSKSKDIALLIEIHNIENGKTLYEPIMNLLNNYNFKKEFEMVHEGGERHIVVHKTEL